MQSGHQLILVRGEKSHQNPIPKKHLMVPMVNASTTNGWEYWSNVYSSENCASSPPNPGGTSTNIGGAVSASHHTIRDMRISDLLASESLVRAKLLFLNVPGLPTGYKNIILHLLKRELHDEVPIQDVIVQPGKWYLHFYRPDDALRVMRAFNGFTYRSHTLVVRFCYPDGTFGDESALVSLVACTNQHRAQNCGMVQSEASQEVLDSRVWSPVELQAVRSFENEMMQLLKTQSFMPYHAAIAAVRNTFVAKGISSYFISDAIGQWSTGFIRIFHQNIKVLGSTVCLATSNYYTQRIRDSAKEGVCTMQRDSWEPCTPDEIRSETQLRQYSLEFLRHFGPQHICIDIPLRILAQSLRGVWPKTGEELAHLLARISAVFVVINGVLYLSESDRHYAHIIDNLAAYQDDEDETGPLDLEHRAMPTVDFDQLC